MTKSRLVTGSLVGAALLLLWGAMSCGAWLEQDKCLDAGGCWDYEHGRCEMRDQSRCGGGEP